MPLAFCPEVIFGAFFELPRVFVPRNGCVVKGQLTLEGGGVTFADFDVSDAFSKLNLVG